MLIKSADVKQFGGVINKAKNYTAEKESSRSLNKWGSFKENVFKFSQVQSHTSEIKNAGHTYSRDLYSDKKRL